MERAAISALRVPRACRPMQPILKVNLSNGEFGSYRVPPAWERDFLGGSALGARLLFGDLAADVDPLSPSAPLLILNGPLTGTAGPAVGRFVVCGKSPATGLWAESNCGGFWGPELRAAGYDGVWITGRAESPAYLTITDQAVRLCDARQLWGQDTYAVQASIQGELNQPGARVLGIGPAGEAGIPFASILCDHGRVAGRTGLGAVMGAKNLKAVAVRGSQKVPVADLSAYGPVRAAANRALKDDAMTGVLRDLGSGGGADYFDYLGMMPKKYFSTGVLEGAERVSGATMAETILAGKTACHACVIACGRVVRLEDGEKRKGPEYETMAGFGPNLGITDLRTPARLGELCDRYGMDTISTSNTIGLAFRLFEMGILTSADCGGLSLNWGNSVAAEVLIHEIVRREGLGELLAQGARAFARHFGMEDEAVEVNGLEVAYHDPRGASGMAIVYSTSPRGACHNQSDYFLVDIGQAETDLNIGFYSRQGGAEKSANVARHQDWRSVSNALVLCTFANVPPETTLALVNAACGYNLEIEELVRCGERAWNLKRVINHRLGLTRANDKLPKAFRVPYAEGGAAGFVPDFEQMMHAYYVARGWDADTGRPSREKLSQIGLDFALAG
jgi:aldehyde:ferredoxin oxidoreductase